MWPLDRWVPVSVGERKQQKWNHLKFSILFAALLRFFFIRSFRFQFVPSLSNIDFQLLVSFFPSFGDSRLYSTCRTFDVVFTKSRNSFRLSATNCISQRGLNIVWHRSDGGSSCIPLLLLKTDLSACLLGWQESNSWYANPMNECAVYACVQFYWTQCSVKHTTTGRRGK